MVRPGTIALALAVCLLAGVGLAQQPSPSAAPADEEEQMDSAIGKFGHASGQAYQCYDKAQQVKVERAALDAATNILRLFGSDRAFFYAAAFGAGASGQIDRAQCAAIIKEAETMLQRLNGLSGSR